MSTAQPPQREQEDQLDPNTTDQQAEAAKHRESSARVRPSGVKKGWDKKARRRHTVASTKYTRGDKLPGHLSSSPANTPKTPAQKLVEEVFENVTADELLSETPKDIEPSETQEEAESAEDSKTLEPSESTQPEAEESGAIEFEAIEAEAPKAPEESEIPDVVDQLEELEVVEESTEPSVAEALESSAPESAEDALEAAESPATESAENDADDTEPIAIVASETDDKLPGNLSSSAEPELVESFTTEREHWPRKRNGRRHDFNASDYPDIEPIEPVVEAVETEEEAVEAEADSLLQELDKTSHENKRVSSKEKSHFKPKKNKEPQAASAESLKERKEPTKRSLPLHGERPDRSQEQQQHPQRQKQQQKTAGTQAKSQPAKSPKPAHQQSELHVPKPAKPARQEKPAKPARATSKERPTKPAKPVNQETPAKTPNKEHPTKPTPKPTTRYRYIKSPSLEQAFRNLAHLNPGAAWRATRIPLVIFFVLFSLLALAVADQTPAIDAFNTTLNTAIQSTRGTLDAFFITFTTFGDPLPMVAICLVVCLILALAKKWDSLAFFITNTVLAVIFVQALKLIFAVPRPGDPTLVPIPGSYSFPSAHSFCSLIVFGMIGLLIFRALIRKGVTRNVALTPGIILLVLALIIGISRIYVGVHWPSDVLGGWLLAGIWLPFAGALYTVGSRKPAK